MLEFILSYVYLFIEDFKNRVNFCDCVGCSISLYPSLLNVVIQVDLIFSKKYDFEKKFCRL